MAFRLLTGLATLCSLVLSGCFGGKPGRPEDAVVRGVHYVGLTVSDLDEAQAFYGAAALTPIEDTEISSDPVFDQLAGREGVRANTRLLRSANAQLRLMQFEAPSAAAASAARLNVFGPGIAHLCYQVADSTQTYQKFVAAGAEIIGDKDLVHLNPKNPVYYGYLFDPDGANIEVEHVDVEALSLPTPPRNTHRIRQVALATGNIDRLVDFYSELLQEANPRRAGQLIKMSGDRIDQVSGLKGSEIEMAWFQVRNLELEMIQYHSHAPKVPSTPRPIDALGYNMILFDVTSLDAARERLKAAGAAVELESQMLDGAGVIFARDPDGNLLGFQTLPDDSPLAAQNFADNGT